LEKRLEEIGPSEAVARWLSKYGPVQTKLAYAFGLAHYLRWLRTIGVSMSPDELVLDNLRCVFDSKSTDVEAKRKHTDWMNQYVNDFLLKREDSESKRTLASAAIKMFYKRNDSPLFGDFKTSPQQMKAPAKALFPEDIRLVLLALTLRDRTPLLLMWQSGLEPSRVFGGTFPTDQAPPVRFDVYGRKMHRRQYSTYLGAESVQHLRLMGVKGFPRYQTVVRHLKETVTRLAAKGVLKNPSLQSWRPYALRHSFSTECQHAGVNAQVREYWMGHISGIAFVYQHPELHEEDMIAEYAKVEPYVSLQPDSAAMRTEFEKREKSLLKRVESAEALLAELKRELGAGPSTPTPTRQSDAGP
jgi:integrase